MKKIIVIPFILSAFISSSQQVSPEKLKVLFDKVDSVVIGYVNASGFISPGQTKVSPADISRYKKLFAINAMQPDATGPAYFSGDKYHPETVIRRTATDYADRVSQNYPGGFSVRLLNADIRLNDLSKQAIKVFLVTKTEGFRASGGNVQSVDTLLLNLSTNSDYTSLAITNIELRGHSFTTPGDKDGYMAFVQSRKDFIRDSTSFVVKCESERKAKIEQLDKLIAAPPHWWFTVGVSGGTVNSNLTEGALGYDSSISGKTVNPDTKVSGITSFGGDAQIAYFFGQKAVFGVGLGLAYNHLSGNISKDAFHIEYKVAEGVVNDRPAGVYRQIIHLKNAVEEKFSANSLSIPISIIYKTPQKGKLGFQLELGASYNLNYSAKSNGTNATYLYEAIYKFKGSGSVLGNNLTTVYETNAIPGTDAWLVTNDNKYGAAGLATLASTGHGYKVGDVDQVFTNNGLSGNFKSGAIGFFVRPALKYNISKVSTLNFALVFEKTSFKNDQSGYRMIDEGQNYNTLLNSLSKMDNTFIGIRLSYSRALFYKEADWLKEKDSVQKIICQ